MVSKVTEQEITAGYLVNWWSIKSILLFLHRVHEAIVKNLTQSTLLAMLFYQRLCPTQSVISVC